MSVINTNVSALIAQSALTSNSRAQSTAMQQLSTGLRINGAKDDAAGLAIASKMTSQIRGLDQAVRNANDGVSMLQTADGAMTAVGDMLQRMREIAVQSSSDTNVSSDRTALNTEYSALKTEIGRVASTTQWNGMNILDGSKTGGFTFQVGANNTSAQQINQTIASIGVTATGGTTALTAQTATAAAAVTQVSTVTIAGTVKAGEHVALTFGTQSYDYTITAEDVASGTATTNYASIATNMFTALSTNTELSSNFTFTNGTAGALTMTANTKNTAITVTSAVNSQGLGLLKTGAGASSIDTLANSQTAIGQVDTAIAQVNATRSGLGATINRLTYAADNLTNVSQNTSASRSRVQDTDYAKASTELARTQIISQAATAMLAQANQSQQSVLALLK